MHVALSESLSRLASNSSSKDSIRQTDANSQDNSSKQQFSVRDADRTKKLNNVKSVQFELRGDPDIEKETDGC